MECASKFRIYPAKEQEEQIQLNFSGISQVHNHYLAACQYIFENEGCYANYYECCKDLPKLKRDEGSAW